MECKYSINKNNLTIPIPENIMQEDASNKSSSAIKRTRQRKQ